MANKSTERVARWRKRYRRFDYVPSKKALAELMRVAHLNPTRSWSAILDALVIRAVAGNGQ